MALASNPQASAARPAGRRGYWVRLAGVALASLLIAALVTRSPPPADPPGYGPGHATPDQPSRG